MVRKLTPQAALREYNHATRGQRARDYTKVLTAMSREEKIEAAQKIIDELEDAELIVPDNHEMLFKSDRPAVTGAYAQKYYEQHSQLKEED